MGKPCDIICELALVYHIGIGSVNDVGFRLIGVPAGVIGSIQVRDDHSASLGSDAKQHRQVRSMEIPRLRQPID